MAARWNIYNFTIFIRRPAMKVALLLALYCLILGAYASPIQTVESSPQDANQAVAQETGRQAADAAPAAPPSTDDDDDDDDDDVDLDLDDDDDDDDDESSDSADDDDDDDDDYFERFFEDILGDDDDDDDDDEKPAAPAAQPAVQATQQNPVAPQASKPSLVAAVDYSNDYTAPGSLEANVGNPSVPPVYIAKYNRFVDNILDRINRILRKNYDPVNVRLHSNENNKSNGKKNNKKKNKNKNRRRRPGNSKNAHRRPGHQRSEDISTSTKEPTDATMSESLAAISAQLTDEIPYVPVLLQNASEASSTTPNVMGTTTELATTKRSDSGIISRARPQHSHHKNNNNKKTKKNNNKNRGRQRPGAKATLYGLSSIRREGDVTVNMMSSHTTVKTKFTVGPLILKVEKEFGRGAKKDIRSATATTTEMTGKLNLRVMQGGAATLHSIRVMQPKQVRVESSDDHDKTREYVWKRSSHIAHVVSQKLTNATKSMLQPPPIHHNNGVLA